MTRSVRTVLLVVTALVAGAVVVLAAPFGFLTDEGDPTPGSSPTTTASSPPDMTTPRGAGSSNATATSAPALSPGTRTPAADRAFSTRRMLLVWTSGGLEEGFGQAVDEIAGVTDVTVVHGNVVDMVASETTGGQTVDDLDDGWAIPLDAFAVDPAGYAPFVSADRRELVAGLSPGEALLGATSAELRGVTAGGTVELASGARLTIAGVVDDAVVGAAELVVARADAEAVGVTTPRHLLVAYEGDRQPVEAAIRDHSAQPVRVRGPGETPFLRYADAVLTPSRIKARFGEFAYRPISGSRRFEQEAGWRRSNLVTTEVPLLGGVRCHRGLMDPLAGAMRALQRRGLDHLVDPGAFGGCHNPRVIAPGQGVSHHAWGIAVDLNYQPGPDGPNAEQDPRLVEVMRDHGFTWGGTWLAPDPTHFEYRSPAGAGASDS